MKIPLGALNIEDARIPCAAQSLHFVHTSHASKDAMLMQQAMVTWPEHTLHFGKCRCALHAYQVYRVEFTVSRLSQQDVPDRSIAPENSMLSFLAAACCMILLAACRGQFSITLASY